MGVWQFTSVSAFMMAITVGILLPAVSADLGLSPMQQGFFGSSAFVGNLVLALPLSWWTSQFRPKTLTTVTLVVGAALLMMQGWAPGFFLLILGRLGFGISAMAREPARALLMHQWFSPREFIFVNSVYNALFGLVVGGGLATTPFILAAVGNSWRSVLLSFVALLSVLTLLWTLIGRERTDDTGAPPQTVQHLDVMRRVVGYSELWIAGIGFAGATLGWAAFLNFYPTFMLTANDLPLAWSGAILGLGILVGGLAGVGLSFFVATLSPKRRKNLIQALGVLMAGTYLAMIQIESVPALLVISAVNGVGWGFWPILASVPFYLPGAPPRVVAIGATLIMTMAAFGTFLGPSLTGVLQELTGDLRLALVPVCFAPLTLTLSGTLLRIRTDAE